MANSLTMSGGTIRKIHFGEAQRPLRQKPLREVKGKLTQKWWIVVCCWDNCWSIGTYEFSGGKLIEHQRLDDTMDYSEFWSALASLELHGRKTWVIGWRLRYAMQRADFVGALERGEVALPQIKIGKNKGKHGGKLTWTQKLLEVDIVAGRNKIKVLDWSNYGVDPLAYAGRLEDVSPEISEKALADFLGMADSLGVSVCKSTSAQLGWDHCRRISHSSGLHVNLDVESRALERRAYHGGRNECFRLGSIPGTTYSLDVKSCYAAICRDEKLPVRCIEEYREGLPVGDVDVNGADHWIADVVIRTDEPDYPLRWDGSPIYPTGRFFTSLAWPELRHALRLGRVVEIVRAAKYEAADALRDYAFWYLQARNKPEKKYVPQMASAVKSMFNSSLGYTAREKYDWVPWQCQLGQKYWLGTVADPDTKTKQVAAQVLDSERRWLRVAGEPFEAMPFLHATICSYARVRLLEIFASAGRENILYCDTDGILCSRQGREALENCKGLTGDSPGQLIQRFAPGRARIQGQKNYQIGDNVIQAGATKTRFNSLIQKSVLTTETGRVTVDGEVKPFVFNCEKLEKDGGKWLNVMA